MATRSISRRSLLRNGAALAAGAALPGGLARSAWAKDTDLTTRERDAVRLIRDAAEPLPDLADGEAFGRLFDRFGDARVVLLGEATHGTSEFYRARAEITKRLVRDHGFTVVAAEADWPDMARVDAYARRGEPLRVDGAAFERFPTWMWRNAEFRDLVEWLRGHNEGIADPAARAGLHGLDLYSLEPSIDAVLGYLDGVDPEAARAARERYACLATLRENEALYARLAMTRPGSGGCADEVGAVLGDLLDRRADYARHGPERFFDAAQNARVVAGAERYYRNMYGGRENTWNLRDRHMFDTLLRLLEARGPNAKAVVWAHNSHIGNAAATEASRRGEFNIGQLCRERFGDAAVAIGFGTDRGTVAAASDWDGPMEIKAVRPVHPDSHERLCRDAGAPRFLLDLRAEENPALARALAEPRLNRMIGVIYRPETELASHYFETRLADQFDAYVWFEETAALTPLDPAAFEAGPPAYGV